MSTSILQLYSAGYPRDTLVPMLRRGNAYGCGRWNERPVCIPTPEHGNEVHIAGVFTKRYYAYPDRSEGVGFRCRLTQPTIPPGRFHPAYSPVGLSYCW